ncbi:MAG: hypothetical protein V5A44_07840 [Haloarculaceae archaeon]
MEHDFEDDASDASGLTAVKLSLVGGFVGTLAGLKRRGIGGAVVGGLVGGTAGYVAGAALDGPGTPDEWEDPLADVRDEPVTVDVGTDDEDVGFDFEGDEEADAEADEAGEDEDEGVDTEDGDDAEAEDDEADAEAESADEE